MRDLLDTIRDSTQTGRLLLAAERLSAALALTEEPEERVALLLERIATDEDSLTRRILARALGDTPGTAADRPLADLLFDEDATVRSAAARAAAERHPRPWAVPALLRAMTDPGLARAIAQGTLTRWSEQLGGALEPYVRLIFEVSSDPGLRRAAGELVTHPVSPSVESSPADRDRFRGPGRPLLLVTLAPIGGSFDRWQRLARSIDARRELAGTRILAVAADGEQTQGMAAFGCLETLALGPADRGDAAGLSLRVALEAALMDRLAGGGWAGVAVEPLDGAAWAAGRVAGRLGVALVALGDGRPAVRRVAGLAPDRSTLASLDAREGWLFRLEVASRLEREAASHLVSPPGGADGELASRLASAMARLDVRRDLLRRAS